MSQALLQAQCKTERPVPARVLIALPPKGLGRQLPLMQAWLDEICGAGCWAMAPAGTAGVVNDAIAFYFGNAALARAFVARFCCGYWIEAGAGPPRIDGDAPPPRQHHIVRKTS